MDGLSAGASGFAVVSIAIQLAESIKTFSEFIGSIREAPADIESILSELQILSSTLNDIQPYRSQCNANSTLKDVLENLQRKISAFMTLVNQYKPGLDSTSRRIRKWNAVKIAFNSKKFKKLRESLNETKITLILARQDLPQRNHDLQIVCQQQDLPTVDKDQLNSQNNQSSKLIVTSSAETSGLHDDHINDLKKEIRRIATTMKNSVLQSMFVCQTYQFLQDSIPNLQAKHDELVLKEEVKLEPELKIEANSSDCKRSQHNESHLELLLDKKPKRRLSSERGRVTTSKTKTLFGTIYLRSVVYEDREVNSRKNSHESHRGEYRFESFFTLHPADWLFWLGMKNSLDVMISRSTRGWKNTFRTFRAVPADALIYDFCKTGNIEGVKTLITRGDASVWDRNPKGRTPLHIAMSKSQYQICKLLVNEGAEKDAREFEYHWSPATYYAICGEDDTPKTMDNMTSHEPIDNDFIRTFFECFEFGVHDGDEDSDLGHSWMFFVLSAGNESDEMYDVIESEEGENFYPKGSSICRSLLDVFGSDIRENLNISLIKHIWLFASSLLFLQWFMASTDSEALAIHKATGRSPIPFIISGMESFLTNRAFFFNVAKDKIKFLAKKGASLHYGQPYGSPTSVAMERATNFSFWCETLQELGVDIESFVEDEIKQGSLQKRGWSKETLVKLFRGSTLYKRKWDRCYRCPNCGSQKPTCWKVYLEASKNGKIYDDDNYGEIDNNVEIIDPETYKTRLCDLCREVSKLPIPGSFDP